jgi:hypothetical protein
MSKLDANTMNTGSIAESDPPKINPKAIEIIVSEIKTIAQTLPKPSSEAKDETEISSWVNARIAQYAQVIHNYGETIETVYLQVSPSALEEAVQGRYSYPVEIETWEDIKEGTYRIEFHTSNPVLDNEIGLLFGAYGEKAETEITWTLWQNDNFEIENARKIAPKFS